MAPMIPADRICISCEKEDGKYKCTKCAKYTCSLPCSKAHREGHENDPQPPQSGEPSSSSNNKTAAEDHEPEGGHSPLTKLFKKYPNLQGQLRAIADSTDPPKDEGGGGGHRLNFNPRRKKEVWTPDIGMQNGMVALRRGLASQDSEGLKEYCELYKHQAAQKAEEGEDPEAAFRRKAAQRDAEVIRKLMLEENQKD